MLQTRARDIAYMNQTSNCRVMVKQKRQNQRSVQNQRVPNSPSILKWSKDGDRAFEHGFMFKTKCMDLKFGYRFKVLYPWARKMFNFSSISYLSILMVISCWFFDCLFVYRLQFLEISCSRLPKKIEESYQIL